MSHTLSYPPSTRYNTIKHVLLVDDNPNNIALTRRALARAGFAVHLEVLQHDEAILAFLASAQVREAAVEHRNVTNVPKSQKSYDLILVDMNLSKGDGFELIRSIRRYLPAIHTPIVVISTTNHEQDVLRSYESGASSLIQKAVDFTEYAQTLREVCSYWLNLNISPANKVCAAS